MLTSRASVILSALSLSLSHSAVRSMSAISIDAAAAPMTSAARRVVQIVPAVEQAEGDGARVRRSIGGRTLQRLDPFLLLDHFDVSPPAGFPPHYHRGFATVTYMLSGQFRHEDFKGTGGSIGPGDCQWMIAGRAIVHSEMPEGREPGRGLQLWVNLPRALKLSEPSYQELKSDELPVGRGEGVTVKVIAGASYGAVSPVRTLTPVTYLDVSLAPGAVFTQPIQSTWNAAVYVLSGSGSFGCGDGSGAAGTVSGPHATLVLDAAGDVLHVVSGRDGVRFMLIAGKPLGEPVVQYGPVVMTTREEINAFFEDVRGEKNGFEGASEWMEAWQARH